MKEEDLLELAPLAALGALDGGDLTAFEQALESSLLCRAEMAAFEAIALRIALSVDRVPPARDARRRLLQTAGAPPVARTAPRGRLVPAVAVAAALVLAGGYLMVRAERNAARRETQRVRAEIATLAEDARRARTSAEDLGRRLAEERVVRDLMTRPKARTAVLGATAADSPASARVVWDPVSREAVLVASGLEPAPAGRTYEVWVIAGAAPVPAGTFQSADDGSALFRLPPVEATGRVKTFAVTLEPAGGVTAPTGPMVLAGPAA